MESLGISTDLIIRSKYIPGIDSASDIEQYQGYFLEVRLLVRRVDKFATFMRRVSRNSWNLNLLGQLQACIWIAHSSLQFCEYKKNQT
jgi:hypothetical protein